ncbi:hypothetical protein [Ruegeria sp. HKCCA6707]
MNFFEISKARGGVPGADHEEDGEDDVDQALQHLLSILDFAACR